MYDDTVSKKNNSKDKKEHIILINTLEVENQVKKSIVLSAEDGEKLDHLFDEAKMSTAEKNKVIAALFSEFIGTIWQEKEEGRLHCEYKKSLF